MLCFLHFVYLYVKTLMVTFYSHLKGGLILSKVAKTADQLYKIFDHETLISKILGIANFNVAVVIIIAVIHCLKAVLMQIFKDITFI